MIMKTTIEWVDFEQTPPTEAGRYLVMFEGGLEHGWVYILHYHPQKQKDRGWYSFERTFLTTVKYWAKLPQTPLDLD